MSTVTGLAQVALAGGDLDETLRWWQDALGLPVHARFDPPGIAFILAGDTRLFFAPRNLAATIYLKVTDVHGFHEEKSADGVEFLYPPSAVHIDSAGQFGPAGETEFMAFLKDPAGNTVGLLSRKYVS